MVGVPGSFPHPGLSFPGETGHFIPISLYQLFESKLQIELVKCRGLEGFRRSCIGMLCSDIRQLKSAIKNYQISYA